MMYSPSEHRAVATSARAEKQVQFSLFERSQACRAHSDRFVALVNEGALPPIGDGPQRWCFAGATLQRARTALRLTHDLALNPPVTALVLELFDQIDTLRARLRHAGGA